MSARGLRLSSAEAPGHGGASIATGQGVIEGPDKRTASGGFKLATAGDSVGFLDGEDT